MDSGGVDVLLFVFFAISFVRPKGGVEWRTMGIFIGFIVALFTEMYGLPLTIYFLSQWLGASYPVLNPLSHTHGHLWLVLPGVADSPVAMTILHTVSNAIIILGFYLLYQGWALIYHNEGKLVTEGVYSHIRHPQLPDFPDYSWPADSMAHVDHAPHVAYPNLRLLPARDARRRGG